MTEPVSLHSFCKENGNLPKTSVRQWLNDHGYSTSDGLSPAAVEAAIALFIAHLKTPSPGLGTCWGLPKVIAQSHCPKQNPTGQRCRSRWVSPGCRS